MRNKLMKVNSVATGRIFFTQKFTVFMVRWRQALILAPEIPGVKRKMAFELAAFRSVIYSGLPSGTGAMHDH
jgi:hypothetical protein